MKGKDLHNEMGKIDDKPVQEAENTKRLNKRPAALRWGALAACAALVVCGVFGVFGGKGAGIDPVAAAQYPQSYADDDYEGRDKVRKENPVDETFYEAMDQFAYRTFAQFLSQEGENKLYSPVSLYYALSLAATGAQGQTQEEIFSLLGINDEEQLAEQCGNLYRYLYLDNDVSKLRVANSLWMAEEFGGKKVNYKKDFLDSGVKNFYASLYTVDFSDSETGKAMGKWVSDNTNGTLEPSIPTDPQQLLSILNTVYFADQWTSQFSAELTKKDAFTLSGGDQVECDFMNSVQMSQSFARGSNFTRSALGLKSGAEMVFVLPDENSSVKDLLTSPESLAQAFEGGEEYRGQVNWKVPKFTYGTSMKLTDSLKQLGMPTAFGETADFSGISDQPAFISNVSQETYIAIDENGVEASAFTQIDMCGTSMPIDKAEMLLDRPFLYGIFAEDGTLLFLGVCENPSAN